MHSPVALSIALMALSLLVITAQSQSFEGRFFQAPSGAYFQWSGSSVTQQFTGTSASVKLLAADKDNQFSVWIDGKAFPVIKKVVNQSIYEVAKGLAQGSHTLTITRRTEALFGQSAFQGLFSDGTFFPYTPDSAATNAKMAAPRKIEFIGDSITCGYGNLGNPPCNFTPDTEDVGQTYAAFTAKQFDAQAVYVAWSGKGVVRNYGEPTVTSPRPMPSFYRNTLGDNDTVRCDFSKFVPDVVVINLGTNDFSTQPHPPESIFVNGYFNLIGNIRSVYPATVKVFAVCGPLIGEPCCQYVQSAVQKFSSGGVYYVPIDRSVIGPNDFGCNGHPSVSGHRKMSAVLSAAISKTIGW